MELNVGTKDWWLKDDIHGNRGIIHAICNLTFQHDISPKKAVELIQQVFDDRLTGEVSHWPNAPWESVGWGC